MKIVFSLSLPRDEASVPVVRHICRDALLNLGVQRESVEEIEVATSEACTNVLKHVSGTQDSYEVSVEVNDSQCEIRVIDTGYGFDYSSLEDFGHTHVDPDAEGGRGIFLMRAMVDSIRFTSEPEQGTIVHLIKHLELEEDSVLRRLISVVTPHD
ncbi:MAG: serine/threonine-protein kinase RsbW [Actinomycetota bacterium]|nr:serine/threonine-protein kinase RsbW [Actinomycetota bacterium]